MFVIHRLLLTLAVLTLLAQDASAGRRLSPPQPVPARTTSENGICTLGVNGPDASTGAENVMYFDGTDNWLAAIKLNSTTCPNCSTNFQLTQGVVEAANISLFFPSAPCTLLVRTRIVRNFATEVCPYPDRFTPDCPEFYTTLYADAEDVNTVKDFHIPFPNTGCAILLNQTKFLELNFFSVNAASADSLLKPRIVPWEQRITCLTYNGFEGNRFGADVTSSADLEMNNPKLWADILWCESAPVTRRTWGRLKQIYR